MKTTAKLILNFFMLHVGRSSQNEALFANNWFTCTFTDDLLARTFSEDAARRGRSHLNTPRLTGNDLHRTALFFVGHNLAK